MRIGVIILVRLDSTRLPMKAFNKIAGKELLLRIIEVCERISGIESIIISTTNREVDNPLVDFAIKNRIKYYRGDLKNVAKRFYGSMVANNLDAAIRINGDSPLQRPALLSEAVKIFRENEIDLVTNVPGRKFPYVMSIEVVSTKAMQKICEKSLTIAQAEHVTKYFYDNLRNFRAHLIQPDTDMIKGYQLAVDSKNDLINIEKIIETLGSDLFTATPETIIKILNTIKN